MHTLLKFLFVLSLTLTPALAVSIGLDDLDEPKFYLRNALGTDLNELFIKMAGDGKTKDAAVVIYVPYSNGPSQENAYYSTLTPNLGNKSTPDAGIYFRDIDTGSHINEELYVAINNEKSGTDEYRIVKEISSSELEDPFVGLDDLCDTNELDCDTLTDSIASINDKLSLVFFYKPKDTDYSKNDVVEIPDAVNQALFFKLVMSAAVSDIQTNGVISSAALFAGDSMAIAEYNGDHGANSAYVSRLAYYLDSVVADKSDFKGVLEGKGEEGVAKITKLQNNVAVFLGLAYLDHFGFIGQIKDFGSVTPRPIETLLAENQCYLVTAGFQRDHYVLNYFRSVRDNILAKTWAGRLFIDFYYGSAPRFVDYILENRYLAFNIKKLSFSTYFVLQNLIFILSSVLLLAVITFRRELKHAVQSLNRR